MSRRVLAVGVLVSAACLSFAMAPRLRADASRGPAGDACAALPASPLEVHLLARTDTSVSLAWTAAPAGRCTVAYRIFQNGTEVQRSGSPGFTAIGLRPGATYSFAVAAVNEVGSSAASAPVSVTTAAAAASAWPGRLFAPYIDVTLQTPALAQFATSTGSNFFTLAFIVSGGGCKAAWGGETPLSDNFMAADIANLRSKGGDVIVSFGGAAGSELGLTCGSVSSLQAQYQAVIDKYSLTYVDFDIEGGALDNTKANDRRNKAIKGLLATAASKGRELRISYTLPVSPQGLESNGIALLKNAKSNGTHVDIVNVMAMDYGGPMDMGNAAKTAAQGTVNQIKPIFGTSDAQTWKMIGITPMIGVNDETSETFSLKNAQTLLTFSQQQNIGVIAFWDTWRDQQCPKGTPQPSDTCSGVTQSANAFTKLFKAFNQ
jgi:chitinase